MVKNHKFAIRKPKSKNIIPKEKPQSEYSPGTVFVNNLPSSCTDSQLQEIFSDVGPLKKYFLVTKTNQKGGTKNLGFGIVQFTNVEDAERSVELKHRISIDGRTIRVKLANYCRSKPNQGAESDGTLKTEDETDVPIKLSKRAKQRMKLMKRQAGVPIKLSKTAKRRMKLMRRQAGEGKSSEKQTPLENETNSAPHDAKIVGKPSSVGETGKPVKPPKKAVKGQAGDGKSSEKQTHLENEIDNASRDAKIVEKPLSAGETGKRNSRKRKADDQSVDKKDGKNSKNKSKNK